MKILIANINDAEDIAKNTVLLAKESENIIIDYNIALEGVKSVISDKNKGFYVVGKEKNNIVGQLMITYEWSDWNNRFIWWLQSVYVGKSFRRKGVFSKLLSFIKNYAKDKGIDVVRLYVHDKNIDAIKCYNAKNMIKKSYSIYELSLS